MANPKANVPANPTAHDDLKIAQLEREAWEARGSSRGS